MVKELKKDNSLLNTFISELRDVELQKDPMRFRKNLKRIGQVFAYEISKQLDYSEYEINTPLGTAEMQLPKKSPVLATVLRAGLPFHEGFLDFFDHSESAFISAFRKHKKDDDIDFAVEVEYLSCPELDNRVLILNDPMLATGSSLVRVYKALAANGTPSHWHVASVLSTPEGIEQIKKAFPSNLTIWTGSVDDELTAHGYIVPGLGDAGDLSYGKKS